MNTPLPIILASRSRFRQAQLDTLGLPYQAIAPDYDETPQANEAAPDTALRLAIGKAYSLKNHYPHHLIIGADQVAWCQQQQLGKPMSVANAQHMLRQLSGQEIDFFSAICVYNSQSQAQHTHIDHTRVTMRQLSEQTISAYLQREPDAIYCAGAAKSEGLGAALLQKIESTDPNALIGLPLFRLIDFLQQEGVAIIE